LGVPNINSYNGYVGLGRYLDNTRLGSEDDIVE